MCIRRIVAALASVLVSSSSVGDTKYIPVAVDDDLPILIPVSSFKLWQLNINAPVHGTQIMGYVIQTGRAGKVIVIDGGYYQNAQVSDAGALSAFIQDLGNHVDMWFITHQHPDHFGALADILGDISGTFYPDDATCTPTPAENYSGPQVDYVFGSFADPSYLASIGTNYSSAIQCFDDVIAGAPATTNLQAGQILDLDGVLIEVLNGWDQNMWADLGADDRINNGSLVLRVSDAFRSVLFTGDIGSVVGDVLVNDFGQRLKSDFVQMPHHGGEAEEEPGAYATNLGDFFEAVGARYCLWPTTQALWGGGYEENVAAVAGSHLCGEAESGRHYKAFEAVNPYYLEVPLP